MLNVRNFINIYEQLDTYIEDLYLRASDGVYGNAVCTPIFYRSDLNQIHCIDVTPFAYEKNTA